MPRHNLNDNKYVNLANNRPTFAVESIPSVLADLPGWMYWLNVEGNPKLPRTIRGRHNHTDASCLGTLDEVLERIRHFRMRHGIGFSFLKEFGLSYVDLDDSIHDGELTPFAADVVERLNSYCEISIGGNGLHVVVRGQVEKTQMHTSASHGKPRIEIVPFGKWMSVSGNVLGELDSIQTRQNELTALSEEVFGYRTREKPVKRTSHKPTNGLNLSSDDFRVCCMLARQGKSEAEIFHIMTTHPIYAREKLNRPDYLSRTIERAMNVSR